MIEYPGRAAGRLDPLVTAVAFVMQGAPDDDLDIALLRIDRFTVGPYRTRPVVAGSGGCRFSVISVLSSAAVLRRRYTGRREIGPDNVTRTMQKAW